MFTTKTFSLVAVLLMLGIVGDSLWARLRRWQKVKTLPIYAPSHREERMKEGKYSIELLRGGEGTDIQIVLAREDNLNVAHTLYNVIAGQYPDRVVMLCDRARVLARNDLLETTPSFS
jgi:hypothetical protein